MTIIICIYVVQLWKLHLNIVINYDGLQRDVHLYMNVQHKLILEEKSRDDQSHKWHLKILVLLEWLLCLCILMMTMILMHQFQREVNATVSEITYDYDELDIKDYNIKKKGSAKFKTADHSFRFDYFDDSDDPLSSTFETAYDEKTEFKKRFYLWTDETMMVHNCICVM